MRYIACLLAISCIASGPLKRITNDKGDSVAVIVPARTRLLHTRQYVTDEPWDVALAMQDAVKINVVARDAEAAELARQGIRRADREGQRPAVSVVIGHVPDGKAAAIDGVLATDEQDHRPRIFISGQAEKGATLAEATAKTLDSLVETLKFVGCAAENVVQAKCFLTPMSARADVEAEFANVFGERTFPLVFVEWKSQLPIEIELVAVSPQPAPADAPAVEYLTPPGMKASPLFARVVRVNRGDLIYIGDIYGAAAGDGAAQVTSIFEQLQDVLKKTNSDLRHLVKATYYVSDDDDVSKQLNALRPKYYDPQRPPAASKAMVPGVGLNDRSICIDMIAVPTTQRATQPAR